MVYVNTRNTESGYYDHARALPGVFGRFDLAALCAATPRFLFVCLLIAATSAMAATLCQMPAWLLALYAFGNLIVVFICTFHVVWVGF